MSENETPSAPRKPKTALYASAKDEIVLRPHIYDGIQEYDQKLPNWWLFSFYGAIVVFVVFWISYYQLDLFQNDDERITAIMDDVDDKRNVELEELLANLDDASLVAEWSTNAVAIANGQDNYMTHCLACHGQDLNAEMAGVQLPGLPLTDGTWKFGGRPMEIFKLINEGSPPESEGFNGARMEVWGQKLPAKTIAELTAFIISRNSEEFASFAP